MLSTGKEQSARGFTLIEVMVVVVIIAVLSGMAALSIQGRAASAELRASANDLLRFAQYGRDHAVTRRMPCRLVIDSEQRRFYLECESDEEGARVGEYEVVTVDSMRPRTLPGGVKFGLVRIDAGLDAGVDQPQAGTAVTFTPLGEANATVIEVTDGEASFTLRIAPATGRAEVVDGRVEEMLSDRMDLDA